MSTTTLKLPDELKARIAALSEHAGQSPHGWMVRALEAQAELAERRRAFIDEGRQAAEEIDAGGPLYAMEDVSAWIRARASGAPLPRPRALREGGKD